MSNEENGLSIEIPFIFNEVNRSTNGLVLKKIRYLDRYYHDIDSYKKILVEIEDKL
jgi:hypothetical protein